MNRYLLILLLFYAAALRVSMVIPAFEGPDEPNHIGYVADIRRTGQLPDPTNYRDNFAKHESAQPPLLYVVGWVWSALGPYDAQWDGKLPFNAWYRTGTTLGDNQNANLFGPGHPPTHRSLEHMNHWLRLLAVWMGCLAVAVAIRTVKLLRLPHQWAMTAMILFAFTPAMVRVFALFGNDAPAVLFGTIGIYTLVTLSLRRPGLRSLMGLGVLAGLGLLSKASLLVFVMLAVIVILLRNYRYPEQMTKLTAAYLLPALVVGLPWYGWHALAYGDPLGMGPHIVQAWAFDPPRPIWQAIVDERRRFVSMWYEPRVPTLESVPFGGLPYAAYLLVTVLSVGAWAIAVRKLSASGRTLALALTLACAGMMTAYVSWLTRFTQISGRLLLPAYLAYVLLVVIGLAYGLWKPLSTIMRYGFAAWVLFLGTVFSGWMLYPAAYGVRTMSPAQVPALSGEPLRFDDIEFMGYRLNSDALIAGNPLGVTLCWRSLRTDGPLTVPYAFGFAVVDGDTPIARRESLPGMGSYTYWQPDRAFCDRFHMAIGDVQPGRAYRLTVGLLDPDTGIPLSESDGKSTFIGWVRSPGPPLTTAEREAAAFRFDVDTLLLSYDIQTEPGAVRVTLTWGTGNQTPPLLHTFVHLLTSDFIFITQGDAPLGGEDYPAFAWGPNERTVTQTHVIPLEPDIYGEVCVYVGLYDPATGYRATAINRDNLPAQDDAAPLGCVDVE